MDSGLLALLGPGMTKEGRARAQATAVQRRGRRGHRRRHRDRARGRGGGGRAWRDRGGGRAHAEARSTRSKPQSRSSGGKAEALRADVSKEADVERLRDFVQSRWGRAKAVINCAGNNCIAPVTDVTTKNGARSWRSTSTACSTCAAPSSRCCCRAKSVDPQRRLDLRAYRQRKHAGLLRGQGRAWCR